MSTIARGNAAEAAVMYALTAHGLPTLIPFGGGLAFDLGCVHPQGHVLRLQVKSGRVRNGCIEFNTCSTDHGKGKLDYRGRADVIVVHVESLSRVFVVPVEDTPRYRGHLRLAPTRNQQRRGVRMAEDYSLERWVASL